MPKIPPPATADDDDIFLLSPSESNAFDIMAGNGSRLGTLWWVGEWAGWPSTNGEDGKIVGDSVNEKSAIVKSIGWRKCVQAIARRLQRRNRSRDGFCPYYWFRGIRRMNCIVVIMKFTVGNFRKFFRRFLNDIVLFLCCDSIVLPRIELFLWHWCTYGKTCFILHAVAGGLT